MANDRREKEAGVNTLIAASSLAGGIPAEAVAAAVKPTFGAEAPASVSHSPTTQIEQGTAEAIHEREARKGKIPPRPEIVTPKP